MTALGLNVLESLLSISMINYQPKQACGCEVVVNDRFIGDQALKVRIQAWVTFHQTFHFSINDHSKFQYLNKIILVFGMISEKKYSIMLKSEIISPFT